MKSSEGQQVCFVCDSAEINNLELGEFQKSGKISVHYYCLLLTSGLEQNGDEHQGLLGFLLKDIRAEVERIKRLKCAYCKKIKANVGCVVTQCRHTFHTNCGLQNGCLMQFEDPYKSYCNQHVRIGLNEATGRKRGRNEGRQLPHVATESCNICYDQMGDFDMVNSVQSPCCKKSWFHKRCLQSFAWNAGYFFKCPMCNNENKFRSAVKLRGVFVPDRDATWELEPNAFAELLERPETCEAVNCVCPEGRDHESSIFEMLRCSLCGSHCVHSKCLPTSSDDSVFTCPACAETPADQASRPAAPASASLPALAAIDSDADSDINVVDDDDDDLPLGLMAKKFIRPLSSDTDSSAATTECNTSDYGDGDVMHSVPRAAGIMPVSVDVIRIPQNPNNAHRVPHEDYLDHSAVIHPLAVTGDPNGSSLDVMFVETQKETISISSDDDDDADHLAVDPPKKMKTSAAAGPNHSRSSIRPKKSGMKRQRLSMENNNSTSKNTTQENADDSAVFGPPQSKRIRRALQTMKNQSKITSFFSAVGTGKAHTEIPVVAAENVSSTAIQIKSENN